MADLICDACKMPPYPADIAVSPETGLPTGWVSRRIAGRTFTLCDCCGNIRHFKGGVSTYLQENLGVSQDAHCDFQDVPGGGLHRARLKRRFERKESAS